MRDAHRRAAACRPHQQLARGRLAAYDDDAVPGRSRRRAPSAVELLKLVAGRGVRLQSAHPIWTR